MEGGWKKERGGGRKAGRERGRREREREREIDAVQPDGRCVGMRYLVYVPVCSQLLEAHREYFLAHVFHHFVKTDLTCWQRRMPSLLQNGEA